jgi:hypothetical protein
MARKAEDAKLADWKKTKSAYDKGAFGSMNDARPQPTKQAKKDGK